MDRGISPSLFLLSFFRGGSIRVIITGGAAGRASRLGSHRRLDYNPPPLERHA